MGYLVGRVVIWVGKLLLGKKLLINSCEGGCWGHRVVFISEYCF